MAKVWLFEGWLSLGSWFQDYNVLLQFWGQYDPTILEWMLLESYWKCASFGGTFAQLWVVLA